MRIVVSFRMKSSLGTWISVLMVLIATFCFVTGNVRVVRECNCISECSSCIGGTISPSENYYCHCYGCDYHDPEQPANKSVSSRCRRPNNNNNNSSISPQHSPVSSGGLLNRFNPLWGQIWFWVMIILPKL